MKKIIAIFTATLISTYGGGSASTLYSQPPAILQISTIVINSVVESELNLNNKKILLRLDLNVPIVDDKITDTTRIDKILPTLNFLISQNAKMQYSIFSDNTN